MTETLWATVDHYVNDLLLPPDAALEAALEASTAAGLPAIQVTPSQGRLLQLMAFAVGAKAILEVGTLGGYSTIWLARALPEGGRLLTLEIDAQHAEVARANVARAGLASRVELRLGAAIELLPRLAAEGAGPFDLSFIDADKPNNTAYFDWALKLSRPGSLIVVDNVVRNGAVAEAASTDESVQGSRRLLARMAAEPRVSATVMQTVGEKGYDGFAIARVMS